MGVDTKVRIVGNVSAESVVEALKTELGIEATSDIETTTRYYDNDDDEVVFLGEKGEEQLTMGNISFEYKGDKRNLFYWHSDMVWVDKPTVERAIKNNAIELIGETTTLSLSLYGDAVEIMTALAKHFDGYIDENDCDDIYYHKVTE